MITAAEAREISFNSRVGFEKVIEYHLVAASRKGKNKLTLNIPKGVWDALDEIRSGLDARGFDVKIETREGCCLPPEKIMEIVW